MTQNKHKMNRSFGILEVLVNLIVFGVGGWIAVLLTNDLVTTYPDLNNVLKVFWVIGIITLWMNTLRINWIGWLFKNEDKHK